MDNPKYNEVRYTICAGCNIMYDGFGQPCGHCKMDMHKCPVDMFEPMQPDRQEDYDLFNDTTFIHHFLTDDERKKLHTDSMVMWQPIRPTKQAIQLNIKF